MLHLLTLDLCVHVGYALQIRCRVILGTSITQLMSFTSWQFVAFAALVFCLYYLPPVRAFQVHLLVAASVVFYGSDQIELIALLALAVLGTYAFLALSLTDHKLWLPIGIAFNLALLAFFKYKFLFIDPSSA